MFIVLIIVGVLAASYVVGWGVEGLVEETVESQKMMRILGWLIIGSFLAFAGAVLVMELMFGETISP